MSHKEEISNSVRLNGFQEIFSDLQKYVIPKGQKISKGHCGVLNSPKKPRNKYP